MGEGGQSVMRVWLDAGRKGCGRGRQHCQPGGCGLEERKQEVRPVSGRARGGRDWTDRDGRMRWVQHHQNGGRRVGGSCAACCALSEVECAWRAAGWAIRPFSVCQERKLGPAQVAETRKRFCPVQRPSHTAFEAPFSLASTHHRRWWYLNCAAPVAAGPEA